MIDRMKTVPSSVVSKPAARSSSAFEILMPLTNSIGDDALTGQVVVDGRHVDLREPGHPIGKPAGMVGLVAIVEFLEDAWGELVRRSRLETDLAGDGQPPLCHEGQFPNHAQVRLGLGGDPRSLDLDRDEGPIHTSSPRDGPEPWTPRRTASCSNVAYRTSGCAPSSFVTMSATLRRANGAASLWRVDSSDDPVVRQDVAPARHHLADLHVGRAELLEHGP